MLFPSGRMQFSRTMPGHSSTDGWLVLNIGGVDLDGVKQVYVAVKDIDALRTREAGASNRADQLRRLMEFDDSSEDE
ncbi:MAG: hypothetical protein KGJ62_03815 [Armatimonadetes bacterium]|nr:hypothetical protein [Armatimonadota bacterium]MDE2205980.1 hypothetical protein [Armatimonadota bacterium]